MPVRAADKGAFRKGAPFLFGALLGLSLAASGHAQPCPAERTDATVHIGYVYDGDTFRAVDGEKVRLIGVNTPELGKDGAPDEPLAAEARAQLLNLSGQGFRLQFDAERRDRYGRVLAHVFLPDGRNAAAILLQQGLATTLHIPPNLGNGDCYRRVEQTARAARRGVWALPAYQPVHSAAVGSKENRFRLVSGRVKAVRPSRKSVWLELDGRLSVRIPRADLAYFLPPPETLLGRQVLARGWVRAGKSGPQMTVRHPLDLEVAE
jgi:endonuclease YncB( thermonuclease family)